MLSLLLSLFSSIVLAANPVESGDIVNSATIPTPAVTSITAPVLITPVDDSITNNPYEQFSWTISTPTANISHYDLYLDGLITKSNINHSTAIDNTIYTTPETPISDGVHTWYVIAYSTGSTSATSETRTFTVDTTTPVIILQAVDKNTMYWASNDPFSIPPYSQRHLSVTTPKPLLSGKIEALSNFKLSLICPQTRGSTSGRLNLDSTCKNQSIILNDPDGEWKHRFRNLVPNTTYTAYLSATDAAGNSNIFPPFTITYTPTPLISLPFFPTPTIAPTPEQKGPTPSVADQGSHPGEVIPPPPPPAPAYKAPIIQTPHPPISQSPIIPYLFPVGIVGLLAHLAMTGFGASIKLSLLPQLLSSILIPPFLNVKDDLTLSIAQLNQKNMLKTLPFTSLFIYSLDPVKNQLENIKHFSIQQTLQTLKPLLKKPIKSLVSGPAGKFNLNLKTPGNFLLTASYPGHNYPDTHLAPHNGAQPFIYHSEPIILEGEGQRGSTLAGEAIGDGPANEMSEGLNPGNSSHNHFHLESTQGKWYIPLDSRPKDSLTTLERLQTQSIKLRSLPLGVSLILSLSSLIFIPSFITFFFFLIIGNVTLNQYLYPHITSK
jgi:hypothetical protein